LCLLKRHNDLKELLNFVGVIYEVEIQSSQPNTEIYIPVTFSVKTNTSLLTSSTLYLAETTKARKIVLLPPAELPWGFSLKLIPEWHDPPTCLFLA